VNLAAAAEIIEQMGRLAPTGNTAAERAHKLLAGRHGGPQLNRAAGKISMMAILGLTRMACVAREV
jgi:hypothetical protein